MTPFEKLTESLAERGTTLIPQREFKTEQSRLVIYAVRKADGPPNVPQIIVQHWPDGGYDSFLPPIVNSIEGDVALITD